MKRILTSILSLVLFGILLSCDSDDKKETLKVSYRNLSGIWYLKSVIKEDGSVEPYIHICPENRDFVQFYPYDRVDINFHFSCDIPPYLDGCGDYILFSDDRKIDFCSPYFNGNISKFTATELQIDYGEVRHFANRDNNFEIAKGIILSRE